MKATASTQLYLADDIGEDVLSQVDYWSTGNGDMAMVRIGMLTIYGSSPEDIVDRLRKLADAIEAQPVTDERVPAEVTA